MSSIAMTSPARWQSLEKLPVGLFGSVMGFTGLSAAWRLAHGLFGAPPWIAQTIGVLAMMAFVSVALGYGIKWVTAPAAVAAEFSHPIAGSLFGTVFISLLLLPLVLAPVSLSLARLLWGAGALGMMVFAWWVVTRWMSDRQQVEHATPAWVVPVVGVLDVPLAMPALGFSPDHAALVHELMVLDVAVGLFFAIPLFTMIFSRLLFQPPMPDALLPTLLILVAPFAVGYSAYTLTSGGSDLFAEALYMLTLFMLAVLLPRLSKLRGTCPFRFSWWAVSFPLAASAIASLRYAAAAPNLLNQAVAMVLLALATTAIAGLLVRTLFGLVRGELRTLSG